MLLAGRSSAQRARAYQALSRTVGLVEKLQSVREQQPNRERFQQRSSGWRRGCRGWSPIQVQGLLVEAARQGLPHRGASGGSRRRLQASRPPLARSVPAHMLLLHISRRLRPIVTCELMMLSCRDACALQDVVLSRRSRKMCSIFAAGTAAGDARQCRVRCSSARVMPLGGTMATALSIARVLCGSQLPRILVACQLALCRQRQPQ